MDRVPALATTAPGLAPLAAQELRARGIIPTEVNVEGASFNASLSDLYTANLWLRTASRIIIRGAAFHADSFYELERRAGRVEWTRFIVPDLPVRLRVTCRKSRLYHSDAVAERIAAAITRAGGVVGADRPSRVAASGGDEHEAPAEDSGGQPASEQIVIVRLVRDVCSISFDSSGALLHRRAYRQETAKAPMRETLAAALLMVSQWDTSSPLLDPFCGAGTIPIEAAWMARRRAPGLQRPFAFMRWASFDRSLWDALVDAARSGERTTVAAAIQASDRDAGAVSAARHNAERAGTVDDIDLQVRAFSDVAPPAGRGWLVTNPPYGVRVGDRDRLRDLYARLGTVTREVCAGWTVCLLAADRGLVRATGLPFTSKLRTVNGGIPVEAVSADVVPTASAPSPLRR